MRIVGAFVLSLGGAIITFCSVLAVLDEDPLAALGLADRSRLADFAAPALANATPGSLATLRPVPVKIEHRDGTPEADATRGAAALDGGDAMRKTTKSAWVPPIVRRAPLDPAPAADDGAPAVVAVAPQPAKVRPRAPLPDLEPATRSALGGPKPGATAVPAPAKPASKPTAAPVPAGG